MPLRTRSRPLWLPSLYPELSSEGPSRTRSCSWGLDRNGAKDGDGHLLDGAILTAHVKSFNPRTAWGILECEAIGDIFVHKNAIDRAVGTPRVGDELQFKLTYTAAGEPTAAAVRLPREERPLQGVRQVFVRSRSPRPRRSQRLAWSAPRPARDVNLKNGAEHFYIGSGTSTPRTVSERGGANGSARVRIANMPWTTTKQKVKDAFERFGKVQHVVLDEHRVGQAIVTFRSPSEAQRSVEELHQGTFHGREVSVRRVS